MKKITIRGKQVNFYGLVKKLNTKNAKSGDVFVIKTKHGRLVAFQRTNRQGFGAWKILPFDLVKKYM